MIFISSDYHLGHTNCIKYCNRPYADKTNESCESRKRCNGCDSFDRCLTKMNQTIIRNHNSRVCPTDIFYHLGDFCFKGGKEGARDRASYWESQLNGKIIHITGNHDRNNGVKGVLKMCILEFANKVILAQHEPPVTRMEVPDYVDYVACGHCVDEETDILTIDGWKNINNICFKDIPINLNMTTNLLEKDIIKNIIINKDQKTLVQFFNKKSKVNFSVTPEHHMIFKKEKSSIWVKDTITNLQKSVKNNHASFRVSGILDRQKSIELSDDEIRFMAWIIADGSIEKSNNNINSLRFKLVKERKINRLTSLLLKLNIEFSKTEKNNIHIFYIHVKKIKYMLKYFLNGKIIPKDFKNLTINQTNIFLLEYGHTDGTIKNENRFVLYTSKECDAEILQYLCIISGHQCNILKRQTLGYANSLPSYVLNISLNKQESMITGTNFNKQIYYEGRTWCIETNNGNIFTRRNGKVMLMGNCHNSWKYKWLEDINKSIPVINVGIDVWNYRPIKIDELNVFYNRLMNERKKENKI